jgi:predicted acyltransferase (DUF342 family)
MSNPTNISSLNINSGNVIANNVSIKEDLVLDCDVRSRLKNGLIKFQNDVKLFKDLTVCGKITAEELDFSKDLTIQQDLIVCGNALFKQNVTVKGNATVEGGQTVNQNLCVMGGTSLKQSLTVCKDAFFKQNVSVMGDATVEGSHTVDQNLRVKGNTTVEGDHTVDQDLCVMGDSSLKQSLSVCGAVKKLGSIVPVDGQALVWNQSAMEWQPGDVATGEDLFQGLLAFAWQGPAINTAYKACYGYKVDEMTGNRVFEASWRCGDGIGGRPNFGRGRTATEMVWTIIVSDHHVGIQDVTTGIQTSIALPPSSSWTPMGQSYSNAGAAPFLGIPGTNDFYWIRRSNSLNGNSLLRFSPPSTLDDRTATNTVSAGSGPLAPSFATYITPTHDRILISDWNYANVPIRIFDATPGPTEGEVIVDTAWSGTYVFPGSTESVTFVEVGLTTWQGAGYDAATDTVYILVVNLGTRWIGKTTGADILATPSAFTLTMLPNSGFDFFNSIAYIEGAP